MKNLLRQPQSQQRKSGIKEELSKKKSYHPLLSAFFIYENEKPIKGLYR